jgi:putative endonuclease
MNWRPRGGRGEIDLVARRGDLLVICEVKARADDRWGHPAEALSAAKIAAVRRTAARFLREQSDGRVRVRFDLAVVLGARIEIWPDAF